VKVVLVDPISSGVNLTEALRERGVEPYHLYGQAWSDPYEADPGTGGKLLHETFDATRAALQEYGAQAVLAASETGVALADQLSAALGLPHNTPELAPARAHKLQEARALEKAGIPCARTESVSDLAEVPSVLGKFERFPVVVKPVDSAGSDGLAICADEEEARTAIGQLLGRRNMVGTINESVLVQEYLKGPQYYLNTVSVDGRHAINEVFLARVEEWQGKPVLRGHHTLCQLSADERVLVEYGLRCLDVLGVRHGASHMEVRLTAAGPRLIETNFRMMGPLLPSDPYVSALGHSAATLWADAVLGRQAFDDHVARPYEPKNTLGFVQMRPPSTGGALLAMPGLDEIRRLPTFHSFIKLPRLGLEIPDALLTTVTGGGAFFVGPTADVERDMRTTWQLENDGLLYVTTGSVASR
jgi:hypothetical protein